jgi:prephenate dehydratase
MARTIAAFQGEAGAFSEEAALALLGDVQTRGYRTFEDLVAAVDAGEVTYGFLPCENTITGSIARSYDLLFEHPRIKIVDETTRRIEQCAIGVPGARLDMLDRLFSHPVALEQCRRFFVQHAAIAAVAADDTAGAVRAIMEAGDARAGAIGGALAAQRYGAVILQRSIQDHDNNFTRFFVISSTMGPRRDLGRICLALHLPHEPGSLHKALGRFAKQNINLRALVARPRRGEPFEYTFYVELDAAAEADLTGPNIFVLGAY